MAGKANDVAMSAPRTPERMSYAPCPLVQAPFPCGYMAVDYDGVAGTAENPWPGQVNYVLDRDASDLRPHREYPDMEEGVAVYVLENSHPGGDDDA